jgi:hypothetical protein
MSPSPLLSAPLVSTVTGGACVLVAADSDEHEATKAQTAPIPSATATFNLTGDLRQICHPTESSLTPF